MATAHKLHSLVSIPLIALSFCLPGMSQAAEDDAPRIEKPFIHEEKIPEPPRDKESIRIATWNIEWFPAGQRDSLKENVQWQVAAAVTIIKEIKPDILLTQETRNLGALVILNKNMTGDAFGFLASSWYYDENEEKRMNDKVQQQNGILSRYQWKDTWEVDFADMKMKNKPARGWLGVRYHFGNQDLIIYTGHLKSNFGAENPEDRQKNYAKRLAAIAELKRDIERQDLDPYRDKIIVCGDFNTDYFSSEFNDDPTFAALKDLGFEHSFSLQDGQSIVTCPAREGEPYGDATFDYILFSSGWGEHKPFAKILAKGASKRKDVYGGDEPGLASDHYPVYVDIPLKALEN